MIRILRCLLSASRPARRWTWDARCVACGVWPCYAATRAGCTRRSASAALPRSGSGSDSAQRLGATAWPLSLRCLNSALQEAHWSPQTAHESDASSAPGTSPVCEALRFSFFSLALLLPSTAGARATRAVLAGAEGAEGAEGRPVLRAGGVATASSSSSSSLSSSYSPRARARDGWTLKHSCEAFAGVVGFQSLQLYVQRSACHLGEPID